jgi:hypothetical protein
MKAKKSPTTAGQKDLHMQGSFEHCITMTHRGIESAQRDSSSGERKC